MEKEIIFDVMLETRKIAEFNTFEEAKEYVRKHLIGKIQIDKVLKHREFDETLSSWIYMDGIFQLGNW